MCKGTVYLPEKTGVMNNKKLSGSDFRAYMTQKEHISLTFCLSSGRVRLSQVCLQMGYTRCVATDYRGKISLNHAG